MPMWPPLPVSFGATQMVKDLRAMNAQIYGTLFASAGVISGDVTVEGTFIGNDYLSSNWDGASPLDLSSSDGTATAGFAWDASFGSAQLMGDLFLGGDFEFISGGVWRTAASGQRIEMTNAQKNIMRFYSGDVLEDGAGTITQGTNGAGGNRTLQFALFTPRVDVDDHTVALVVRSASPDGVSYAPGIVITHVSSGGADTGLYPEFRIQNAIPFLTDGDMKIEGDVSGNLGLTIWNNNATGYGNFEIGGKAGAYIDFKNAKADDYDYRFIHTASSGDFNFSHKTHGAIWGYDLGNQSLQVTRAFSLGTVVAGAKTSGLFYHVPPSTGSATNATWTTASGTTQYLTRPTSSRRWKRGFRPFKAVELDHFFDVASKAVGTFKWKDKISHDEVSPFRNGARDWGGIAEMFDEGGLEAFVGYQNIGGKPLVTNLAYAKMVAPLIAAVHDLRVRVNELEERYES